MPTRIVTNLRRNLRGRNALLHVFELWVGLAGIIAGIVFFYRPASISDNAISVVLGHTAAACWVIGYMVAGCLIWYGLLRPSPKWEVAALWLLGGATATNGLAILGVFGWRGAATAATLVALTVASWLRALIVQVDVLRLAETRAEGVLGGDRG